MASSVDTLGFVGALAERRAWLECSVRNWKVKTVGGARLAAPNARRPGELAVAATLLDSAIEELRVAEEELQVAEESSAERGVPLAESWFETLFTRAPEPYLVTDERAVIRDANRAAGAILRFPWNALAGKPLAVFVPLAERAGFRDAVRRCRDLTDAGSNWPQLIQPHGSAPCSVTASVSLSATVHGRWLLWMLRPDGFRDDPDFL